MKTMSKDYIFKIDLIFPELWEGGVSLMSLDKQPHRNRQSQHENESDQVNQVTESSLPEVKRGEKDF